MIVLQILTEIHSIRKALDNQTNIIHTNFNSDVKSYTLIRNLEMQSINIFRLTFIKIFWKRTISFVIVNANDILEQFTPRR